MSKGNMLLGYARGSVGDLVFSRQKGQQITKARNRTPYNPRTDNQMTQRAIFSNAVKFFTRGVQNLFKFAFENKKPTESDFNAFMRFNRDNGCVISRQGFDLASYPALGKYVLSKGSLLSPNIFVDQEENTVSFDGGPVVEISTVGDLSKSLQKRYNLQKGDFVTFLQIIAYGSTSENTPTVYPEERQQVKWQINQIEIDPTDSTAIRTALSGLHYSIENAVIRFVNVEDHGVQAASVIFSRNSKRGVKCSTSYLVNNIDAAQSLEMAKQESYIQECLESWKSEPISILQGSIVTEDPATSKYIYSVFADQACTKVPQPGERYNRLYLRINQDMTYAPNTLKRLGNPLYPWQDAYVVTNDVEKEPNNLQFKMYDKTFISGYHELTQKQGTVITIATINGTTVTLGNNLITNFELK